MKKLDDQTLMAYVDSELSEEESKEVELSLTDDPRARDKVEEFRKTRAAIDRFADILDEPVPEHLIEKIRQHEPRHEIVKSPERPRRSSWFLLAASLVVGVSLGTIGTKYYTGRAHEKSAIAASKMAGLEKAIEAARAEKKAAQEKSAIAETKIADIAKALEAAVVEKEAARKNATAAEARMEGVAKELEVAVAEKEAIQEKTVAAETRISKALKVAVAEKEAAREEAATAMAKAKYIDQVFPLQLVEKAIENGSKVSADLQKIIVAELNAESLPVSTVSSFSRLSSKPTGSVPATGASQIESLEDLQPGDKESEKATDNLGSTASAVMPKETLSQSIIIRNVLGEFSYAGKTCRLFEYELQNTSEAPILIACKISAGGWGIVQSRP